MGTWKAFRRNMDLLQRTDKLLKAKAIRKPAWYDAVKLYPPDWPPAYTPKPPRLEYPEDRLLEKYYRRNPQAKKHQVFNLMDQSKKPPALVFVLRQLELMQGKASLSEAAAYSQVCLEMKGSPEMHPSKGGPQEPNVSTGETKSLSDAFDDWMNAEASFWRTKAQNTKNKAEEPEKK